MSKRAYLSLGVLTLSILLSGCTGPVDTQSSEIETPSMWSRLTSSSDSNLDAPLKMDAKADTDQNWWTNFKDPTLVALIGEALANNKTLQIAKSRVEEARAGRRIAQSALLPQINGEASASRSNQGYATLNQTVNLAQIDVAASWELDLFGKNQARTAQAEAILESSQASQQAVRVALLSEVARTYFDMRNYERQVDIAKQNLALEKKTLQLIEAQKNGALASDFDVQRAAAQVSTTESLIPTFQTAYDSALNRLNVLVGVAPGSRDDLLKTTQELKPLSPLIVVSAPAKVIATRPDIRVAERNFAATISGSEAARAALFPDISLTALFGAQSSSFFNATPWGVGANLVQPLLNWGRLEAQVDQADEDQKQAFLTYQETVLEGLEDMENSLSGYIHETQRNASLAKGVDQNRTASQLADKQYRNGYTGLLDVLVAQRSHLDAEASQADSDAALRNDLVHIYTAAGGGWQE